MKMFFLLARLFASKKPLVLGRPKPSRQLVVEQLEDRLQPSTIHFTQLNFTELGSGPPPERMTTNTQYTGLQVAITIARDSTESGQQDVDFETDDGTAVCGEDYVNTSGTATFGQSDYTVTVYVEVTPQNESSTLKEFLVKIKDHYNEDHPVLDTCLVTMQDDGEFQTMAAANLTYYVGQNMTLGVEAHLGLLANAYNPAGAQLAITGINEQEINPEDDSTTLTLDSGATLTVYNDGSFDYVPVTDSTDADSFTVAVSDGDNTSTATVTLNLVATGESADIDGDIYVNNSGPLTYTEAGFPSGNEEQLSSRMTSSSEDQPAALASQFTVTSPFFSISGGEELAIAFPVMASTVRIPRVSVQTNVPLANSGPATLNSVFQNFYFVDSVELARHIGHVRQDLEPAIADLDAYFSDQGETDAVDRWFADSDDFGGGLQNGNTTDIQAAYTAIVAGLDGNTMTYRCDPTDTDVYGRSPIGGVAATQSITIGALYFQDSNNVVTSQRLRYWTVIHELSHFFGPLDGNGNGVDDYGYFESANPPWNTFWYQQTQMVWYNGAGDECVTLTTDEMIQNADSYGGFLAQYYFHW